MNFIKSESGGRVTGVQMCEGLLYYTTLTTFPGSSYTGQTSLVERFTEDKFRLSTHPTIGGQWICY